MHNFILPYVILLLGEWFWGLLRAERPNFLSFREPKGRAIRIYSIWWFLSLSYKKKIFSSDSELFCLFYLYVLAYGSHVRRDKDVPSLTILIYDTPASLIKRRSLSRWTCISVVLLNFMCSSTARTWGMVRTNIYQAWVLNNPHLSILILVPIGWPYNTIIIN